MGINASKSKNKGKANIENMAPGTYPARLVAVIDIGLHPQRAYQGKEKEPAYEILTIYEFLDEFLKDEEGNDDPSKPRWLSESFPLYDISSERARSTARYIALDPTMQWGGDWAKLANTPCLVTVINNPGKGKNAGRVYDNISNVAAMRPKDAAKAAPLVNDVLLFDMDNPSVDTFNKLPDWIKKRITESLEFPGSKLNKMLGDNYEPQEEDEGSDDLDDEVPF